jgi:hypothetical protein
MGGIDGGARAYGSPTDGITKLTWSEFSRSMDLYWVL